MSEQKLSEQIRRAGTWNDIGDVNPLQWADEVAALEAKLEAMGRVVQAGKEVWDSIPSVLGPDDSFEIRRHAATLNALKKELNALAAAQEEE